ncbi:MAG: alpha-2-macroglobulin family protein [bacterium JZ-2024 1]
MRKRVDERCRFQMVYTAFILAGAVALYWTVETVNAPWLRNILKQEPTRRGFVGGPFRHPGEEGGEGIVGLIVQPTGQIEREFPRAIVFHIIFRGVPKGAEGVVLSAEEAKPCIRITPYVPGQFVWTSSVNLEYRFLKALSPRQAYRAEVECIPVTAEERLKVQKSDYVFRTPGFGVYSAELLNWAGPYLTARVKFNLPLEKMGIRDLVSVSSGKGELLTVTNLVFEGLDSFTVSFPNVNEDRYEIVVKPGLRATVGNAELGETIRIPLYLTKREIYIKGMSVEEGERGYSVVVHCVVQGEARCPVAAETVRGRVTVDPSIETRVLPTQHGFRITGPFLTGQTYEITLHAGIRALDAVLRTDYADSVTLPSPTPRVQFPIRGGYLGRNMGLKLPLRVRATEMISVSVWRIPPENWVFYREERWRMYGYGEPVIREKDIPVEGGREPHLMWVDLGTMVDTGEPGIYLVTAKYKEKRTRREQRGISSDEDEGYEGEYWEYETRSAMEDEVHVVITDLALIAKRGVDRVWAWAVDARTTKPRAGVRISLYSQKNVLMGRCVTGDAGGCELPYERIRDREPTLIVAQKDAEMTYIHLNESEVSLEPFSVSGIDPTVSNLVAYLYPERDLYRPGETVHFAVVVRNRDGFEGVRVPVTVEVNDPNGKRFGALNKMTDEAGFAEYALEVPPTARTGRYSFSVKSGETYLTSSDISVETFVPERMSVMVTPERTDHAGADEIRFAVRANYLFGAPAGNAKVEFLCVARETKFRATGYEEYHFGRIRDDWQEPFVREQEGEGQLNEDGEGQLGCRPEGMNTFYTMADVRIGVSVQEAESGRVSRGMATVKYHPFDYYIGLKTHATRVEQGRAIEVDGVILNYDGTLKKDVEQLHFQVAERTYEYGRVWDPNTNQFRWETSYWRYPTGDEGTVRVIDGKFKVRFTPTASWVDYVLEVRDLEGKSATDFVVYGWSWGKREKMETPEVLKIRLSKEEADSGERVHAEILLPFEGRLLWTLESEGVLRYEWQDARGATARLNFSAPTRGSSVYVSALLIRSDEQYLVRRAFGVHRLSLRPRRNRLDLTMRVPSEIRPGKTLEVTLEGNGRYQATIAIVDEGILQISRFASPDVYEGILRDTALKVRTSETLGWIVPKGMMTPGGGEGIEGLRIKPAVKLVSYWSGLVKSDARGRVTVRFPVPEYLGKLRVMASAMNEQRLASAEAFVTVTTEVAVLPTFPRFVYAGDMVHIPVTLINTTRSPQMGTLKVIVDGKDVLAPENRKFEIAEGTSVVMWAPITVKKMASFLEITVSADWSKDKFRQSTRVPILPDHPYVTETNTVEVSPGETVDLTEMVKGWLAEDQNTQVVLAPSPALSVLAHLKYLVQYPYGCLEQTSSSLLPMIRLKDIVEASTLDVGQAQEIPVRVRSGIARLISMQTPSGGFSFWPGGEGPGHPYASVYATFVLLQAKNAGYEVPESVLNLALEYIARYARAEAFGYYVLAEGNRLDASDVEHILNLRKRGLSAEELYFLAAALARAGKTASARGVLEEARTRETRDEPTDSSRFFWSPLRSKAIAVFVHEIVEPGDPGNDANVHALAQLLTQKRQSNYYHTQELAWASLALGLRMKNVPYARTPKGTLKADEKVIDPKDTKGGLIWVLRETARLKTLTLTNESDGTAQVFLQNSGFKPTSFSAYSENGLRVEKAIVNPAGEMVRNVRHGETYFVRLVMVNTRGHTLENVAIEDFVPAGFEVENPRLPAVTVAMLSQQGTLVPDYVDYRDERVRIFGTVPRGSITYFYQVRATLPGSFYMPPVNAMAMYDPEVRAGSAPARLEVAKSP